MSQQTFRLAPLVRPVDARLGETQAYPYLDELFGGYGLPSSRHPAASEDALWPDSPNAAAGLGLTPTQLLTSGRLYVVADGVSLCPDGHEASRLVTREIARAYYSRPARFGEGPEDRRARLQDAVWQAHQALLNQRQRWSCWRRDNHADGQAHVYSLDALPGGELRCPECGGDLAGLQATCLAIVVRGPEVTLVAVGNSVARWLPAGTGSEILLPPEERQFLGATDLRARSAREFPTCQVELWPGDQVLLYSDGVEYTLKTWPGEVKAPTYLRRLLAGPDLTESIRLLLESLEHVRHGQPNEDDLDDDLTLLAVFQPPAADLQTGRQEALRLLQALPPAESPPETIPPLLTVVEAALRYDNTPELWAGYGAALLRLAQAHWNAQPDLATGAALGWFQAAAQVDDAAQAWLEAVIQAQRVLAQGDPPGTALSLTELVASGTALGAVDLLAHVPNAVPPLQLAFTQALEAGLPLPAVLGLSTVDVCQAGDLAPTSRKDIQPFDIPTWLLSASLREQLLAQAEQAMQTGDWSSAQAYLAWLSGYDLDAQRLRAALVYQELLVQLEAVAAAGPPFDLTAVLALTARPEFQSWLRWPAPAALLYLLEGLQSYTPTPAGYQAIVAILDQAVNVRYHDETPPPDTTWLRRLVFHLRTISPVWQTRGEAPALPVAELHDQVRRAARLAFGPAWAWTVPQAGRLLYDLGQRSPKSGLSQADWQALGSNPEAPFAIQPIEHQPDIISFTVLAEDLVAAAELETVRRRAQTFRPEDQQMNQAAADLRWLEEWRQQDASTRLPPMLGETPWRVARRLAETRLAWGQGRWKHALLTLLADPEPAYGEPLQAAWQAYTEAIWRYAWESALDPAGTPPDQLWGMITELEDFRNQPGFGPPAFDHPATSPSPSLRAGSSVFRLAAAAALLHAAWHALRQDWGQAASQIIDALDCLPDDPARQAQILALAQQRYIGNWPAVHAWNLRRWRHEPAIRAAAQRLEQAGVDWARIFLDTLDARQAGRTRERRWLLISAVVVVGLGLASPLLIRPARNVPAPPPVLPPVVAPVASPTLNPAAVLLPLDASRPVTVELAAGDLAMTGLGQAAPLTATTVISPPVPGDLPAQPLFLFTGRLHGPLTQEPGGRLRLAIVWPGRETQPVTVTLLAGKSTGPVIEDWRLNHGGWVWLLGQVPALAEAILACSHAPAGRVCPGQQALLAGPAPLNIDALALAGLQSDGQLTFLASGQPLAQRWVYADLGPYGAQPALPAAARQFVAGHGAGWGLLRLDWDPVHHLFSPAVILHPEANGVYRLWWKNS